MFTGSRDGRKTGTERNTKDEAWARGRTGDEAASEGAHHRQWSSGESIAWKAALRNECRIVLVRIIPAGEFIGAVASARSYAQ